jgi:hypothetical protein
MSLTRAANPTHPAKNGSHGIDWVQVVRTNLDVALRDLPVDALPDLIGTLAAGSARATLLLNAPASAPSAVPTTDLLTAEQLATVLNVKPSVIYAWHRQGLIPAEKFNRFLRFDLVAVRTRLANPKPVRLGIAKRPRKSKQLETPLTDRLPAGATG